jgi:hypothetical protein
MSQGGANPIAGKPPLRKFCANFNAVGGKRLKIRYTESLSARSPACA